MSSGAFGGSSSVFGGVQSFGNVSEAASSGHSVAPFGASAVGNTNATFGSRQPFGSMASNNRKSNPFSQSAAPFGSASGFPSQTSGFNADSIGGRNTFGGNPVHNAFDDGNRGFSGGLGAGFPRNNSAPGLPKAQPTCRVCQATFGSFDLLKKHIKAEKHFDSPAGPPAGATAPAGSFHSPAVKPLHSSSGLSAAAPVFTPQVARLKTNSPPHRAAKKPQPQTIGGNAAVASIGTGANPFKPAAAAPPSVSFASAGSKSLGYMPALSSTDDTAATDDMINDDDDDEEEEEEQEEDGKDPEYFPSESENNNLSASSESDGDNMNDDEEQDDEDDVNNVSTDSVVGDQLLGGSTRAGTHYGLAAAHTKANSASVNTLSSSEGDYGRPAVSQGTSHVRSGVAAPHVDTSKVSVMLCLIFIGCDQNVCE